MKTLPAWTWILGCIAGAGLSLVVGTDDSLTPLGVMGWSTASLAWCAAILGALR